MLIMLKWGKEERRLPTVMVDGEKNNISYDTEDVCSQYNLITSALNLTIDD